MATLAEVKAQNAADEAKAAEIKALEAEVETDKLEPTDAQSEVIEGESKAAQDEPENKSDDAQSDDKEAGEGGQEQEAWLDVKNDSAGVPVEKHIGMKTRLKGTIKEQSNELDELRAQMAALQQTNQPQPQNFTQQAPQVPKYEDFDTDEQYQAAKDSHLIDLAEQRILQRQEVSTVENNQSKARELLDAEVSQHYERAAKVIESAGIAPEKFQAADSKVRRVVESALPARGEIVTDTLIASLGEGSEKVMYYLGSNEQAQDKLARLLREDPNGIKASMFLGELKADKAGARNVQRKSNAPAPAARANGGDSSKVTESNLQKKYEGAKDPQAKYNLKKQAKAAGFNVKSW